MNVKVYDKKSQAYGAFNGGEIVENKPLGFPQEGGTLKPYSNLFYWANAIAKVDSTIGLHPHKGFEIMSFVLNGTIRHYDTKLDDWKELHSGDVQIIRAGNGISHAEFMAKDARMFQIWFDPNLSQTLNKPASYNDYSKDNFVDKEMDGYHIKFFVGDNSPISMDSNVEIYSISTNKKTNYSCVKKRHYSIYILEGEGQIQNQQVKTDDFILCTDLDNIEISSNLKLFVISANMNMPYSTYASMRS